MNDTAVIYQGQQVSVQRRSQTFLERDRRRARAQYKQDQRLLFRPQTSEPVEGWLSELASDWFWVMADLEHDVSQPIPTPPTWTDSKQLRREALKKLAMGQKFGGQSYE